MIMLIQHAEKKENSSSKRYEMSKRSFGDGVVTDWNTVHCQFHFIHIGIPGYAQINDELYTFSRTFLAKEPIHNLTLEIYGSFPICVLSLLLLLLQIICQIATGLLRHCHWTSFFKKHRYNIYDMFNVLIRNNEQFD